MKLLMKKAYIITMSFVLALAGMAPALPVSAAVREIPITKVSFPTSVTIKVGESRRLNVVTNPSNSTYKTNIEWAVQTNGRFTYRTHGYGTYWKQASSETITGKQAGTGYLNTTVKVYNSKGTYLKKYNIHTVVKVVSASSTSTGGTKSVPLTRISLNKTSAILNVGNTTSLSVSFIPSNTTSSRYVSWRSSNSSVASVSGGRVTAKKAGTATITATAGGKSATCFIRVREVASNANVNVNDCYTILNQYRARAGRRSISRDATLERYAQIRAKELVQKYSHTRPNGTKGTAIIPWSHCGVINRQQYRAENIAMGQTSCREVMTDWYNSSGHRANMLSSNHRKVGIGAYKYNGVIYWVQLFAS